ncbi:MAG: hypothetical protein AAF288_12760, partial [Planctomycetota bacterium]
MTFLVSVAAIAIVVAAYFLPGAIAQPAVPAASGYTVSARAGSVSPNGALDTGQSDVFPQEEPAQVIDGVLYYTASFRPPPGWMFKPFPGTGLYADGPPEAPDGLPMQVLEGGPDKVVVAYASLDEGAPLLGGDLAAEGLLEIDPDNPPVGNPQGSHHWSARLLTIEPVDQAAFVDPQQPIPGGGVVVSTENWSAHPAIGQPDPSSGAAYLAPEIVGPAFVPYGGAATFEVLAGGAAPHQPQLEGDSALTPEAGSGESGGSSSGGGGGAALMVTVTPEITGNFVLIGTYPTWEVDPATGQGAEGPSFDFYHFEVTPTHDVFVFGDIDLSGPFVSGGGQFKQSGGDLLTIPAAATGLPFDLSIPDSFFFIEGTSPIALGATTDDIDTLFAEGLGRVGQPYAPAGVSTAIASLSVPQGAIPTLDSGGAVLVLEDGKRSTLPIIVPGGAAQAMAPPPAGGDGSATSAAVVEAPGEDLQEVEAQSLTPAPVAEVPGSPVRDFDEKTVGAIKTYHQDTVVVTWTASAGAIDANGLFTAPLDPEISTVTVTAVLDDAAQSPLNGTRDDAPITLPSYTVQLYPGLDNPYANTAPMAMTTAPSGCTPCGPPKEDYEQEREKGDWEPQFPVGGIEVGLSGGTTATLRVGSRGTVRYTKPEDEDTIHDQVRLIQFDGYTANCTEKWIPDPSNPDHDELGWQNESSEDKLGHVRVRFEDRGGGGGWVSRSGRVRATAPGIISGTAIFYDPVHDNSDFHDESEQEVNFSFLVTEDAPLVDDGEEDEDDPDRPEDPDDPTKTNGDLTLCDAADFAVSIQESGETENIGFAGYTWKEPGGNCMDFEAADGSASGYGWKIQSSGGANDSGDSYTTGPGYNIRFAMDHPNDAAGTYTITGRAWDNNRDDAKRHGSDT